MDNETLVAKNFETANENASKMAGAIVRRVLVGEVVTAAAITGIVTNSVNTAIVNSVAMVRRAYENQARTAYSNMARHYAAAGVAQIPFDENEQIQRIIDAIFQETSGNMRNISQNMGVALLDDSGHIVPVRIEQGYQDLIDQAILNIESGTTTVDAELRRLLNDFASSGIREVNWDSGYSRCIESSARMNIMDGVRLLNMQIHAQCGKEFGANGVEISAHGTCAPDHLEIQGRQYSLKAFEKLNSNLDRPIGTCNCRHFTFPIVLGISEPTYTSEELATIYRDNITPSLTYNGRNYTPYQITQVQRRIETNIRTAKRQLNAMQGAEDTEGTAQARARLNNLYAQYRDVETQTNVRRSPNRLIIGTA